MFNAQNFCDDYNISWANQGKNIGQGWIGVQCPFCDDTSFHGGFNIKKEKFHCWRCGSHWIVKAIAALAKTDIGAAKAILKKYSSGKIQTERFKGHDYAKEIVFPPGTGPLTDRAKRYLEGRNFDPDKLAAEWGLLSTGHIGDYKFSILAPIYLRGQLISYQCRDVTGKAAKPYNACPIEESVYDLKYSLYGVDKAGSRRCMVVEGIPIVWRLGPGAVATFGIKFTSQQILLLVELFDDIFILFDAENQAQEQADKLYHAIVACGKNAEVFSLPDGWDLDDLSDNEVKEVMEGLGL